MSKILITGGSGFIGSHVVDQLQGHEITLIGNKSETDPKVKTQLGIHFDGIDWDRVDEQDYCIHLAANNDTQNVDESDMFKANVYAPIKLFTELKRKGCKKFIYASTTAVYGNVPAPQNEESHTNPLTPYAKSKKVFDDFAMDFASEGVTVIGLRLCNIYGPRESRKGKRASMIYQIFDSIRSGKNPQLFKPGTQRRDWCYVKDVVRAIEHAMEYPMSDIFNIGSGYSVSFIDIVKIINDLLKTGIYPEYIDCPFPESYQFYTQCDISKAKRHLGWYPIYDCRSGIEDYLKTIWN